MAKLSISAAVPLSSRRSSPSGGAARPIPAHPCPGRPGAPPNWATGSPWTAMTSSIVGKLLVTGPTAHRAVCFSRRWPGSGPSPRAGPSAAPWTRFSAIDCSLESVALYGQSTDPAKSIEPSVSLDACPVVGHHLAPDLLLRLGLDFPQSTARWNRWRSTANLPTLPSLGSMERKGRTAAGL